MKLKLNNFFKDFPLDLILIFIYILTTFIFVYMPMDTLIFRKILSVLLILFIPGYLFIAILFPAKKDLNIAERVGFSLVISLVISSLLGLLLNFTPWGLRLDPISFSLIILTFTMMIMAYWRRNRLKPDERFELRINVINDSVKAIFSQDKNELDKILSLLIICSIFLSIFLLVYAITMPKENGRFTEFYLLGANDKAADYPKNMTFGTPQPITIGVINHEDMNVTYDLVILLNDSINESQLHSEQITLLNDQLWEQSINLTPDRIGNGMKFDFLLYTNNSSSPYRELHLFANVTPP